MSNDLAAALPAGARILLDFDGPVCSVFSTFTSAEVAYQLRCRLGLPQGETDSHDPFDVLKAASEHGTTSAAAAERELTMLEVEAVASAEPTPGCNEVLNAAQQAALPVVIVSNNAAQAVTSYLARHELTGQVTEVVGRTDPDPALLKPSPHLVLNAAARLDAVLSDCVLIGDSATDITAAKSAGVKVIAYANKPGKLERFQSEAPTAIITSMYQLADEIGSRKAVGRT